MMASTGHDVHPSVLVPRRLEVVYGGYATHWIHPVILSVYVESQQMRKQHTERHVQMNDMGILNAAILSTKGMRAWAPGANICAEETHETKPSSTGDGTDKCSILPNPSRG